MDIFTLM
jgi:hypothetical protein